MREVTPVPAYCLDRSHPRLRQRRDRVRDQDRARGGVGHGVGDAPEHPAYAFHAFVSYDDEVGPDLLGYADDGLSSVADGGVDTGSRPRSRTSSRESLQEHVGRVNSRARNGTRPAGPGFARPSDRMQ